MTKAGAASSRAVRPAPRAAKRRGAAATVEDDALARVGSVRISHPDKLYWPDEGYAKLDLLRFYLEVFDRLRPYVRDRLLSLQRCPDGMKGPCFFQKEKPVGMPADTPTQRVQHVKKVTNYVVGGKLETQLALANLGCIAVHVWNARCQNPRRPDWVCFDLDPDSGRFSDAAAAALRVKAALDALDLLSFPKTSGGKGLHVFVPIRPVLDCDEVLDFAQRLGTRLAAAYPKELTMESRIANRKGRVYLDPFRNGFGQTVVSPYSVRRNPKAPFSMPLAWSEVKSTLDPTEFNLGNYRRRLGRRDPWKDFWSTRQALAPALRAVRQL